MKPAARGACGHYVRSQITGEQRLRLLAWPLLAGLVDTYDEKKAAAMFRVFVKNGTWQTPTLAILDRVSCMSWTTSL